MESSTSSENIAKSPIDRRSFMLGMITAFAECLANECKKMALSPPFYPGDYESLLPDAERIAREQGIFIWYEENPEMDEKSKLQWFVMYKFPEVLAQYRQLRDEGYNPAWDFKRFFDLLSYGTVWGEGAEDVLYRMREIRETGNTVSRLLLRAGDWPPVKA